MQRGKTFSYLLSNLRSLAISPYIHTYTHTHTHIYIYICVCVGGGWYA